MEYIENKEIVSKSFEELSTPLILYFSATGNSKYVATRIAEKTNAKIASIADCIKDNRANFNCNVIGIVSPTYDWGLPSIVKEFLQKASLSANYIYFVATYGTTCGGTGKMAKKLQVNISAFYSVKMVDTWTPIFDLSTIKNVNKWQKDTELMINMVIDDVLNLKKGNFMHSKLPYALANSVKGLYENARQTKNLNVNDNCIGCSLCEKKCPVDAIKMKNGKPYWVKDKCVMCLGCLHRCPKNAINYKNKTNSHGQYTNPNVKI